MTAKFWDGASWIDIGVRKFWDGASWIDIGTRKFWDGASWLDIAFAGGGGGSFSATVTDTSVFGSELRVQPPIAPSVLTVGSDSPSTVTVTPSEGTGPYTYEWSHVSGDSAIQVVSPTAATTGFLANLGRNQSKSAVKRCTVTDSLGAIAIVDVGVTLQYTAES